MIILSEVDPHNFLKLFHYYKYFKKERKKQIQMTMGHHHHKTMSVMSSCLNNINNLLILLCLTSLLLFNHISLCQSSPLSSSSSSSPSTSSSSSSRLEKLDLSSSNISMLPQHLFCDQPMLHFINLTANSFSEVINIGLSGKRQSSPSSLQLSTDIITLNSDESSPSVTSATEFLRNITSHLRKSSSSGSVNTSCSRIESITRLELARNKLRVLSDRGFSILPKLETLNVSQNLISRCEETSLQGLSSLKQLDLSNNQLVALPPRIFQSVLSSLEELLLQNNSMSVLPPGLFSGLRHLIELDLSHNEITSHWVGQSTFSDLISLKILDLGFNRMTRIESGTFKSLTGLTLLNLNHNEIEMISDDAFSTLSHLQTLVLSHNRLTRLDSTSLSGLSGLTSLSLDNNRIESLQDSPDMFKNVTSLFELNLSSNKLRSVPQSIQRLTNLRSLDLSYNLITDISNTSYQGIEQLYGLNLEANRIGNLSRGVFSDLPSLRILNLAKNRIVKIDQGIFDDVPDLHALRLDSNQISDINGLFATLRDLLMLNVSANRISWFDYALIPIGLQWLDLHSNNIEQLGNYFELEAVLKLRTLDVSKNKISEIDSNSLPDGIEVVYLNHNHLKKIAPFTFMEKQNLTKVDMSFNKIQNLEQNSFRLSKDRDFRKKLPEFSLSGNPYVCDCNMEWFKNILRIDDSNQYPRFVDSHEVTCHLPFHKSSSHQIIPLSSVKSSSFLCPYTTHCFALCHCCDFDACDCKMMCPDNCSCFYDQTWGTNLVDCSNRDFKIISQSAFPIDVTELYLDGNNVHTLSSHTFIGRKNMRSLYLNDSNIHLISNRTFNGLNLLQVLHLQNNHVTALNGFEFEGLMSLRELYLRNNKISVIANHTFAALRSLQILDLRNNHLIEFKIWTLRRNININSVMISGNPWSCNCRFLKQLHDWLQVTQGSLVKDSDITQCRFNSSRTGLGPFIWDYNPNMCTNVSSSDLMTQISVATSVPSSSSSSGSSFSAETFVLEYPVVIIASCSGFLLLILVILMTYMYRKEVKVWIHSKYGVRFFQSKSKYAPETERLFDAFVSYCKKDEAFIAQILAPELECGHPPYRLCLRYRDLPLSGYVAEAITEAIESSHRTIILLSKQYLKSESCRFELKVAHQESQINRNHQMIVVLMDKSVLTELDPDAKLCLRNCPFVQWEDKMFWEKLRYEMPPGR